MAEPDNQDPASTDTAPDLQPLRGRRLFLAGAAAGAAAGIAGMTIVQRWPEARKVPPGEVELPALFDDIERRTFNFFWENGDSATGLIPDRWPGGYGFASIAGIGFGLTAYGIGVDRGFITRAQALDRTLATVRFFRDAPQGEAERGFAGHRGFFYHFLDGKTGLRFKGTELSTVDTALLLAGLLFSQSFFDGNDAREKEIRDGVDTIYSRIDWAWACPRSGLVAMGWQPDGGFLGRDWNGYNEAMLIYLLAMASPNKPLEPRSWEFWSATHDLQWGNFQEQRHLNFGPLFGHQYSHVWVDYRGIRDDYARQRGFDYFENSRRATLAQRSYAIANPKGWAGYNGDVWGLTACDGPGHMWVEDRQGRQIEFRDYFARGASLYDLSDDGTIAPTAALGSLPFAPEVVIPTTIEMHRRYGEIIYGKYGFIDSFNENFVNERAKLTNGKVVKGFGWVATDYLGIDQGTILAMISNHRNGFIWNVMRRNEHLKRGLARAGFRGGWLP